MAKTNKKRVNYKNNGTKEELDVNVWYNTPRNHVKKYNFRTVLKKHPQADKGEQFTMAILNYETFRRMVKSGHKPAVEHHMLGPITGDLPGLIVQSNNSMDDIMKWADIVMDQLEPEEPHVEPQQAEAANVQAIGGNPELA